MARQIWQGGGPLVGAALRVLLYNRYTWPSPLDTIGSAIAVRELREQVMLVRKVQRANNLFAVATLDHTNFPTRIGVKQRPHLLNIKNWVRLGPDQMGEPLPAPDANPVIDVTPTAGVGAPPDAEVVPPPTAKQVVDDEIIF